MEDEDVALQEALQALQAQLAELDALLADDAGDESLLALHAETLAAIADAQRAGGEGAAAQQAGEAAGAAEDGSAGRGGAGDAPPSCAPPPPQRAGVPHTAAPGNAGIHPRNRCARCA
jgi:hypothetical protein